jgi:hypothetical protein
MSETVAARQAALLVHGLAAAAQRAVLAKLAKADAERLKPLLAELANMGVSPTLGRQLNASVTAASGSSPEQRLEQLTADAIADALGGCAAITIAQFMRAREWPWKAHALARLPEPLRGSVSECLQRELPMLPPAAVRRLCERLCERIERAPVVTVQSGSSVPAGFGSRLKRMLGWTR